MTEAQIRQSRGLASPLRSPWQAGVRSLQFKASLLVVLVVVVVTIAGVAISTRGINLLLYENEFARTLEWATSLAAGTSEAVESNDRESLTQTANDLIRTRAVSHVGFADASGRLLASQKAALAPASSMLSEDGQTLKLEPMHAPKLIWYDDLKLACAEVVVPVYSISPLRRPGRTSRPIVGYLRFATDITQTKAQLEQFANQLSRIGMALVLLAVPCSLWVTRHVVSPLNELARTARAIADGSIDARADIRSNDEIGDLAVSFNTMADRLTASQLELLQLNAELEKRVQERTHELAELAARDPLTGLYNRRYFGEVVTREFAVAERYDADLTCLMFDLDHFKRINDQFGHRMGDAVLITLARAIAAELRESDVAARFGGDEVIVLLPQTSAASASMLVDRIVSRFRRDVKEAIPGVTDGVSVGVASLRTTRSRSAESLINQADVALYAAKQAGRNQTVEAPRAVPTLAQAVKDTR